MTLSQKTIQAIRDYEKSVKSKPSSGLTYDEIRTQAGISERAMRQLMKAGVIILSGYREARRSDGQKYKAPVYLVEAK